MTDLHQLHKALSEAESGSRELCTDFDEDCYSVDNKVACALYAPECGYCPFVSALIAQEDEK